MDNAISSERPKANLWRQWPTYLWRWALFGAIGGALQPVLSNLDTFWEQKLYQMLGGLPFGVACFLAFTPLQNWLNPGRTRVRSWLTVLGTWFGMKFAFFGVAIALGLA